MCAIAITADVSFKTALAADFKRIREYRVFTETEAWCRRDDSAAPCCITYTRKLFVFPGNEGLKVTRQDDEQPTEPSEGNFPSDWMKEGACLASSCGMEGHLCGNGHCLKTLSG